MPNWKKVLVSGSDANIRQLTLGASGTTYSLPSSTGSTGEVLVVQSDSNLSFGSVVGALNDGTISSSAQIADHGFINEVGDASLTGSLVVSSSVGDIKFRTRQKLIASVSDRVIFRGNEFGDLIESTQVDVSGSLFVNGISVFKGGVAFGDNTVDDIGVADFLTLRSHINSDIIPSASGLFNLGSGSLRWGTGYIDNISASGINVSTGPLSIPGYADVSSSLAAIEGGGITLPANIVSSSAQTINFLSGSHTYVDTLQVGQPGQYVRTAVNVTGSLEVSGSFVVNGNIESVGRISTHDGMRSVFVGNSAGEKENPGFIYNTGIGYATLGEVTSGPRNTGLGFQTLGFTTTGQDNIGIGYFAGLGVFTGIQNIFIGTEAGGGNFSQGGGREANTAIGHNALRLTSTANNNTAVGALAGRSVTTGGLNVLMGWRAGGSLTTGISNIALGANAGYLNMNGDENIIIGYNTATSASGDDNTILIGAGLTGRGANTTTIGNSSTVSTKLYGTLEIDGITNVSQSIANIEAGDITLPAGVISSSAQIDANLFNIDGLLSSSHQVEQIGFISASTSVVSSSAQIDFTSIQNNSNIVSSSAQIDFTSIQNTANIISSSTQLASAISGAFDSTSASLADSIAAATASISDFVNGVTNVSTASYALTASLLDGRITPSLFTNDQHFDLVLQSAGAGNRELGTATAGNFTYNPNTDTLTAQNVTASTALHVVGPLSFGTAQTIDFSAGLGGSITASNVLVKNNFTTLGIFTADVLQATASKADAIATSSFAAGNDLPVFMGLDDNSDGYVNPVNDPTNFTYNGERLLVPALTSSGNVRVAGDLKVTGNINAAAIHTTYVTSSVSFYSSSNKFGDETTDIHAFTGSIEVTNDVTASRFSGDGSGLTNVSANSVAFSNVTGKPTLVSSSQQVLDYGFKTDVVSSSAQISFADITNKPTNFTGSYSELSNIPGNIVSSSNQIASNISGSFTEVSASFASTIDGLTSDYSELTNIPSGIISSSAQIDDLFDIDGLVSSSDQVVNHLPAGTVSSSAQVNAGTIASASSLHGSQVRINATGSHGVGTVRVESGGGFHLSVANNSAIRIGDTTTTNSSIALNGTSGIHLNTNNAASAEILVSAEAITDGTDASPNVLAVGTDGRLQTSNIDLSDLLPDNVVSSSAQIDAFGFVSSSVSVVSSSAQIDFTQITGRAGIVSSSTQVIDHLPAGTISGSTQVLSHFPAGVISSSAQIDDLANLDGVVSSSTQISDLGFISSSVAVVSSSAQIDFAQITNRNGVVSSSTQVVDHLPSNTVSSSNQVINFLPAGTISGSAQIDSLFNQDGVISGSEQFTDINAPFTGSFTGSFFGDGSGLTGVGSVSNGILFGLGLLGGTYNGVLSVTSSLNTSSAHFQDGARAAVHSSSFASRIDTFEGKTLFSSSAQVSYGSISSIPNGIISGAGQIDEIFNLDGIVSSSDQIATQISGAFDLVSESIASDIAGNFNNGLVTASANLNVITFTEGDESTFSIEIHTGSGASWQNLVGIPANIVSSSTQTINNLPANTVSGSEQVDFGLITGTAGIISSSEQVVFGDVSQVPNGIVSSSTQVTNLISAGGILPAGTLSGSADGTTQGTFTLNGNTVNVGALSTTGNPTFANLTVTGNLTTTGTVTNINSTDLSVEDKFILLNSGSSSGNGGLIVQTSATNGVGASLFYDDTNSRWALDAAGANADTDVATADANIAAVANSNTDTNYQQNGNLYVDGTDVFIWVE